MTHPACADLTTLPAVLAKPSALTTFDAIVNYYNQPLVQENEVEEMRTQKDSARLYQELMSARTQALSCAITQEEVTVLADHIVRLFKGHDDLWAALQQNNGDASEFKKTWYNWQQPSGGADYMQAFVKSIFATAPLSDALPLSRVIFAQFGEEV